MAFFSPARRPVNKPLFERSEKATFSQSLQHSVNGAFFSLREDSAKCLKSAVVENFQISECESINLFEFSGWEKQISRSIKSRRKKGNRSYWGRSFARFLFRRKSLQSEMDSLNIIFRYEKNVHRVKFYAKNWQCSPVLTSIVEIVLRRRWKWKLFFQSPFSFIAKIFSHTSA